MSVDPLQAAAFAALLEETSDPVLLIADAELRISRAGIGAAGLARRTPGGLRGMSLIAAFGSAGLDTLAREALSTRAPTFGEAELGARSFAVQAVPLSGGDLVLAMHEITAQRRIERVRRDFVANISHELRTPLASIKLLAETLAGGAADDPSTAREFVSQIEREVDHLAQLVDELLDLSMIESGETVLQIGTVEPQDLIANVAERIRPVAARAGVSVLLLPQPAGSEGVVVAGDGARLEQALLNLAHNGVKYNRPGGELRLGWSTPPGTVSFRVADDGIGIPEAHQQRIFERFYKVDRSRTHRTEADDALGGGSAGLGLAIVRHIAEAHGGSVGVESRQGAGSTFWIEIPRSTE